MLKNKKTLKLIVLLLIMVMSVMLLTGCEFGKKEETVKKLEAYEEPIKNFVEGLAEANAEKLLSAFPPVIAEVMETVFTDEVLEETLKNEFDGEIEISFKTLDKEEISETELREMEEEVEENFGEPITITRGYSVNVEITTKVDGEVEKDDDVFEVFEIDGKYYMLDI